MPKATQVLAALRRDGWTEIRRSGSHRRLKKGDTLKTWAFHDGSDLGNIQMTQIAKDLGYTLEELRQLL